MDSHKLLKLAQRQILFCGKWLLLLPAMFWTVLTTVMLYEPTKVLLYELRLTQC